MTERELNISTKFLGDDWPEPLPPTMPISEMREKATKLGRKLVVGASDAEKLKEVYSEDDLKDLKLECSIDFSGGR